MQSSMLAETYRGTPSPFRRPLLKWVGSKQRFAHTIISHFPEQMGTYYEPFIGSGAVLGTLAPGTAIGSDSFEPLMEIWQTLRSDPKTLKHWYKRRWDAMASGSKVDEYEKTKASYNASPNGADLLFLSRSCYGGIVRFRKSDGYMSTPCGVHNPISPNSFATRVDEWHERTSGVAFHTMDYERTMDMAVVGDMIYCDPPYSYSQSILYGSQSFSLSRLFRVIERCKARGVYVALSIDGTKKSGQFICDVPIPDGLFAREIFIETGRSMLKRFQMKGRSLDGEVVRERLMVTY